MLPFTLIGEGKTMELMLTGDMISADEALASGLVNYVCPPDELEANTMELANRIAEMSPGGVGCDEGSSKERRSNEPEGGWIQRSMSSRFAFLVKKKRRR